MIKSLPARGVWVEIRTAMPTMTAIIPSLPARGVWVEIMMMDSDFMDERVTSREGSVG